MSDVEITATLLVRSGPRKGKRFSLDGEEAFRIGKLEDCELVLRDEFVSPLHTVVERRDDVWVAVNRGVNGTLVNQQSIEGVRVLEAGDLIQVGGETLIEFGTKERRRKRKQEVTTLDDGKPKPLWQRPVVLVGLGAYLLALIVVAIVLSSGSVGGGWGLTRDYADQLVEASRSFLESDAPATSELVRGAVRPDDPGDPSARYWALVAARRSDASGDETARLVDGLVEDIDARLFDAWRMEQRRNWSGAVTAYRAIERLVPTLRCPATAYAVSRLSELVETES